jgi:hypothetical protein
VAGTTVAGGAQGGGVSNNIILGALALVMTVLVVMFIPSE